MRIHTLLAAAAAGSLVVGGSAAVASSPGSPATAGTAVAWANTANANAVLAATVPTDLGAPVQDLAANSRATAAVTTAGALRVWGQSAAPEVEDAPTNLTQATAVSLSLGSGAALNRDGTVTAWGSPEISEVPSALRAKAISMAPATGYAVRTDGTLATWGAAPSVEPPTTGLTDLVDVSAALTHVVALKADGTVIMWGLAIPGVLDIPDFGGQKVTQIDTGNFNSGVVLADGSIKVWGGGAAAGVVTPPDFAGKKVISLDLYTNAGAVTEDGVVHMWGNNTAINTPAAELSGQPVADVAVGTDHVIAQVTTFRDLTKPALSGTPQAGKTLTATPATFSLTPDAPISGQWYSGTAPINGQTGSTLALTAAHVGKAITYRSTATRGSETVASTSAPTSKVKAAPIVQAASKVSIKAKASGKTKKIAKKVTLTVTVKTTPKVSPLGKVTITFKGKSTKKVIAPVNKQGKATVTLKKVKRGTYTATVKYAGSALVKASTTKKKFKV